MERVSLAGRQGNAFTDDGHLCQLFIELVNLLIVSRSNLSILVVLLHRVSLKIWTSLEKHRSALKSDKSTNYTDWIKRTVRKRSYLSQRTRFLDMQKPDCSLHSECNITITVKIACIETNGKRQLCRISSLFVLFCGL